MDKGIAFFNSFDFILNMSEEKASKSFPISRSHLYLHIDNVIAYKIQYVAIFSIILDCTFHVEIIKGPRGLGLSVSGGIDSSAPYPGLVRIKRLFPHQAAWATGQLQTGDILLEANGIILTGLTNNVSRSDFAK